MNLIKWFFPRILIRKTSRFNKDIKVMELFGRRFLRVDGLTQSGSIVEDIYGSIFQISNFKFQISNALILGLAGGSFAKIINKKFPNAKITGVEIDPVIIEISKEYLELDKIKNLKVVIDDANDYVKSAKDKYDLIFVDMYSGDKIASFVDSDEFLKSLKKLVAEGSVVFNRLNFSKYKSENYDFLNKLNLLFSGIRTKKSYSNLIVYCTK